MSKLIEVYYTAGPNFSAGSEARWLDPATGKLYVDANGKRTAHTSHHLPTAVPGVYRTLNNVSELTALHTTTLTDGPASQYPDGNPKSVQGAKKFSLRYLPLPAAIEVNRALEDGAKKYGAANWRQTGVAATVYVDAALRHLAQWFDGGQKDAADSGVHNLGHAMACLAILVDAEANGSIIDDRPFACKDTDGLLLRAAV